jgi:hypothetical protein
VGILQPRRLAAGSLVVAAQTIALGYTIITDCEKEFARVKGLPKPELAALKPSAA